MYNCLLCVCICKSFRARRAQHFCANDIFPIHISRFTLMHVLSLQRFTRNSTAPAQMSTSCIQSSTCIIIHVCSLKRMHEGASTAKLVMFLDCTARLYLQTISGLQERQIVPPCWRSIRGTLPTPLCEAVCMPAYQCPAKEVRSRARGAVFRATVTPSMSLPTGRSAVRDTFLRSISQRQGRG
jgi:hypothetical protein